MVIGGQQMKFKYEVISLDNADNYRCQSLSRHPFDEEAIGTFINGNAMSCTGSNNPGKCLVFNRTTKSWEIGPQYTRNFRQAATLFTDSLWFITGGQIDSNYTAMYDAKTNTFDENTYAEMPFGTYFHEMVGVNETHAVLVLGNVASDKVWIFNRVQNVWKSLPNMPETKSNPVAGLANGELVVTGGVKDPKTFIYSFQTSQWRSGTDIDVKLRRAASVAYEDTFLLVGGYNGKNRESAIRQYDLKTGNWIQRQERLSSATQDVCAFLIPQNYIDCDS